MNDLKDYLINYLNDTWRVAEVFGTVIITIIIIMLYLLVGWITAKLTYMSINRYFMKRKGDKRGKTLAMLTGGTVKVMIWFVVLLAIIDTLGYNITPFLASAGILGLAIGFGAQNLVRDVVAGFFIIVDGSFNIGETIEVGGFRGSVKSMNLRVTHVTNFAGSELIINNGSISQIINWSRNNTTAIIDFGVDYATDLAKLSSLMPELMTALQESMEDIIETPSFLGVTDLADSSINLRIIAKTKTGTHFATERKIRQELVAYLGKHNVSIPFPQVVVHQAINTQK